MIGTDRLTAIFDLDGVFVENPPEALVQNAQPITDLGYWERHWSYPERSVRQQEMVRLASHLSLINWQIIVLTARPQQFRGETERLLRMLALANAELVMIPQNHIGGSASWKQETVKKWVDMGVKVMFMVEDHRPNAEAIRAVVPVLLYEYKRPSRLLKLACTTCGGLSACWCPPLAA
jgi:hypothetical protein